MVWLLCHQCHNLVIRCEEVLFSNNGVTPEQHAVLMAIKYINDPVKPTDVARWIDRRPNNISLITERMEKAGLINRIRDLPDRRSIRLVMTKKGEKILRQATISRWNLVRNILSDFSPDELQLLSGLMERVRERAFHYLQPSDTIEEVKLNENEEQNIALFLSRINESN